VERPATVVNKPDDGLDVEGSEPLQTLIGPRKIQLSFSFNSLPQHGIAQRFYAGSGKKIQIRNARIMSTVNQLIEELIADTIDGALNSAP